MSQHSVGSISTTLYGNGRAKLDFGNCEAGQNIRFVKVYLDGTEIDSAPNLTPSKSIEFDFTDGSVLKISEHTESILQFNSLEIICEGEKKFEYKKPLKNPSLFIDTP